MSNHEEQILQQHANQARELVTDIGQGIHPMQDGISFLDLKNETILSYMIDLTNITLKQLKHESIENHASVDRCVENRVILEKIRLIDQRLAYQLKRILTNEQSERIDINNLDLD